MSLLRQAEAAVKERSTTRPVGQEKETEKPLVEAEGSKKDAALDNALAKLLQYVPTEATTIYLATISAVPAIKQSIPGLNSIYIFWAFAVGVSPLLFMLIYFNQLAQETTKEKPFPGFVGFPWFRFVASGIAFVAWALCIPGNPYVHADKPGYGVLWSIVAIAVAIFLPLIENIYKSARLMRSS